MTERKPITNYLPGFMREMHEISAICGAEEKELEDLYSGIRGLTAQASLMHCSEDRIREWESVLGIVPAGNLIQRRLYIRSILSRSGKLTELGIKRIVNALTEGEAAVSFSGSILTVKVMTPGNGEIYFFPDVERALSPLVPAHINLVVEKYYSTWRDIMEGFPSWGGVKELSGWNTVKNYVDV